jgi:glycosyltransferase involved in cell wall biosynthesis
MKIAYLNPGGAIGGAEMCLLDVLSSLRTARPDATPVVLLGAGGPLQAEVEALGIPCEVLPLPGGVARLGDAGATNLGRKLVLMGRALASARVTFAYARRLARWIRATRPDLVQTNGMKMHLLGTWATPRAVPVVWHLHDYLGTRPAMARLLRMVTQTGVESVAVSHSVAADAMKTLSERMPIRVIHNGVDVDRFSPGEGDPAALDRAAGLVPATGPVVRVGLVATFATWKGHDVFLEAVSRIPADRPARFFIVGGPIYESSGSQVTLDDLKRRAAALGVAGRVGFTGYQADPAQALRSLDVVVHASTRPEPFGRVIVEGMACGRAVVAMSEGGAAELFRPGEDALGCAPRDPSALAGVIMRLIDDPPLRRRLGESARQAVLCRFDRTRLALEWTSVYDRAASPALPSSRSAPFAGQPVAL